jgi:hypothetical protein
LIFPHVPKQIFLRAGGNDIHAGRTPKEVAADFLKFVRTVHERLPKTEILFIALSPAPARWGEGDKTRELNRLIREMALQLPRVGFVDAYDISLTTTRRAASGGALTARELWLREICFFSRGGLYSRWWRRASAALLTLVLHARTTAWPERLRPCHWRLAMPGFPAWY